MLAAFGCSSSDENKGGSPDGGSGGASGSGGSKPGTGSQTSSGGSNGGSSGTGGSGTGGKSGPACTPSGETETECSGGKDDDCDGFIDCLDPDCEGLTCGGELKCLAGACLGKGTLPDLPRLDNVSVTIRHDNAIVDFSAFDGAKDYRIYTLPAEDDVLVGQNGEVAVKNAVYRCGGAMPRDDRSNDGINGLASSLAGQTEGYTRKEEESKLGYVYMTPGAGRVPVYRVADPNLNGGYMWEYNVPPTKDHNGGDYVTSVEARDALLAKGWRDDGIAFYAPSNGTKPLYRKQTDSGSVVYYTDGPEKDARSGGEERFKMLAAEADGTVPLYRIFYLFNKNHDTLAPGEAYRARVLNQGNIPITSLMWPGLKGKATLVVEALDQGCPWPGGFVGAMAAPSAPLGGVATEKSITLDEGRLTSGEVFINGQYEPTNRPKPIARAYVNVEPQPAPQMDWFESFDDGSTMAPFQKVVDDNIGTRIFRNDKLSIEFLASTPNHAYGKMLGQFVAGSSSTFTVVPVNANARVAADKYLHATMMVDVASTNRRYPAIWITTAPLGDPAKPPTYEVPMAEMLGPLPSETSAAGNYSTLITQTFGPSPELQMQLCDKRGWGVSQQCPLFNMYGYHAGKSDSEVDWKEKWLPVPLLGEIYGTDRLVKWDVYASTTHLYLYIEDKPAGCSVLPDGKFPAGPVTVAFNLAAYHIEIDEFVTRDPARFKYWERYSVAHTDRKLDDLGVSSGVDLPPWPEATMLCGTRPYAGFF